MKKIIFFILAVLYALLPIDLVPDMLVGWGWIDDLIIIGMVLRFILTGKVPAFFKQNRFQSKQESTYHHSSSQQQAHNTSDSSSSHLTPHEILGVSPSASQDDIRAAYLKLANQYHPDKVHHLGKEFQQLAEIKFKAIQQAYQSLINDR